MRVAGRSLVRWAVDLLRAADCDPVTVVLPPDVDPPDDVADEGLSFEVGGPTRQESVANALHRVASERVVIHDAARPLAKVALLSRVLAALHDVDGVIPVVPIDETIKRVTDGRSVSTVDRSGLWRAQTPSAFTTEVLRKAHDRASEDRFIGTDEAQLVERYGGTVAVVEGSRTNIKVTYPEDVQLVERIMGSRL
jgi:2-C-methyl-D-erythritol 4-phosphate cytidylyltransferase